MKKITLYLCSLMVISLLFAKTKAFSQTLVAENKMWSYYTDTGTVGIPPDEMPTGYSTVFSFGPAEMVDGQTYHRLRAAQDFLYEANWLSTDFLMREDAEGMVYLKVETETEQLVYDFTLEVGDMFDEPGTGCSYTLLSKDSIAIDGGIMRERFNFEDDYTWIKGIGRLRGMLPSCTGGGGNLICFQEEVSLLYTGVLYDETGGTCLFFPVNTEEVIDSQVRLFPNPTTNEFVLQAGAGETLSGELTIYNATGQRVAQRTLTQSFQSTISVNHLPAGMYHVLLGGIRISFVKI